MKVAVLSGGRSSEHEVSLVSGKAVADGLRADGHEVIEVLIAKDGGWSSDGEPVTIIPGGGLLGADVAFPVLHGPFGEDGATQGALDTAGIAYVGSDVLGSAVCMDKLTLKRLCGFAGLPQVDFVQAFTPNWKERAAELRHPLWVKPSRLGSSVGIVKVEDDTRLEAAVEEAASFDPRVIIEANSAGREIECSVLGNENPETSMPGEIIANADWYDYEAKYTEGRMNLAVPADIGEETIDELRKIAAEVFTLAGCSGLARCDFFVEADGAILINEINTIPGFTETSVYAKLWEASGLAYPALCTRLVELAIERHRTEATHSF
ncbi:MAG TPA: D-alanine--D-alanine ligase family protein [Solirubrobacterales bacterium]|nr:D-alanine--D-alanine ligase family protein [Solirubrobacterales bacterium]